MPEERLQKPQRNSALEIPRIIAMIFIVFSHYAYHGVGRLDGVCTPGSFNYYMLQNATLNVGTDIFVLIFGYFCITSIFSWKKAAKLWFSVWSWSVLLYLVALALGRPFDPADLKLVLLPVIFNEYWFFTAYTVLFLFTPFLNRGLNALSRKEMGSLLALMLVLWSALPMIEGTKLYGSDLLQLLMLYVIGAYLRRFPDCLLRRRGVALAGLLVSIAALVVGLHLYIHVFHISTYYIRARHSLVTVGFTASLVSLCASLKPFHWRGLNWVAGGMFGVYLIHENPFLRHHIWGFFHARDHADDPLLILHMLAATAIIMAVGVVADHIKSALLDKPFARMLDRKRST